jgi:hypothetical protein
MLSFMCFHVNDQFKNGFLPGTHIFFFYSKDEISILENFKYFWTFCLICCVWEDPIISGFEKKKNRPYNLWVGFIVHINIEPTDFFYFHFFLIMPFYSIIRRN